ncbi:hypothetical protein CERZMDRAFT_90850 [Cercospora zeae-maydis SCOH1-5]|uniref:Uncharacterized protein n=1 Tax=Cercospora zeae-maydis SCOH1-5 TaxID=717836 RepID=A0A6A6FE28_9PEZI|nr:hypothetical protein CERZMDRAFT_90850 [Cercospora zeae-maydis SCOH1-5]
MWQGTIALNHNTHFSDRNHLCGAHEALTLLRTPHPRPTLEALCCAGDSIRNTPVADDTADPSLNSPSSYLVYPIYHTPTANMTNTLVGDVYLKIIEEVITASQADFEEGGVGSQTLGELQQVCVCVCVCVLSLHPPGLRRP